MSRRQTFRTLLPLGLGVILSLPGDQTLYVVLPTQTSTVGISLGAVGILLGVNRLIRIPGNPIAGMLYDRRGRRHLFLLGLLLGTISTALYGLVRGFWPFLGSRLLWGVAWSLINVGGFSMMLDVSDNTNRGRSIGLYQVSFLLGLSFSPMLGGFLTDALGFRPAVFVCATITGIGLLIAFLTLPETRQGDERVLFPESTVRRPDRQIIAAAYIYLTTLFTSSGVLMSTISLYLERQLGDNVSIGGVMLGVTSLGGMMLALRSLLGILAGPTAGYLSDRRGERRQVIFGGALFGAAGFLVLSIGSGLWAIASGVILIALGGGTLTTALFALVGDATAMGRQGRAIGGLAAAGDVGSAAGPILAYALAAVVELRWVYLLCAVVLLSGLIATRGLRSKAPTTTRAEAALGT